MKTLVLTLAFVLASLAGPAKSPDRVSMTLRNNMATSIPLVIPGVMNPNLSPFSNSGVTVAVGQKFYFYPKGKKFMGKKELLFEATPELDGKRIIVNELIKERMAELTD